MNFGNNGGSINEEGFVLVNGISFSDNCFFIVISGEMKLNVFMMIGLNWIVIDLFNIVFVDFFSEG